ncbi:hypothetical protein [Faecalispora anaeroviscerum]|uniref:hypothetical protein n=1 Tax=Faecalispora anaeroviscerum TaxID=2991836 RepID=UPI0024B987B6|nr:hypothetical protein [Faecalispora anaeroviscerum]
MDMSRDFLTSIEIRSLMLDTLAYEDTDLDSEGKNFKKYGYQGGQSDLYRLLENLAIKRKLIPSDIKVYDAAWGGSGLLLHSGYNTNFSPKELLKIHEQFHYLLNQGIISPGGYGNCGYNLPYFHVTEYGMECLKQKEILPHDEDGYLHKIASIPNIDEWIEFYIKEALRCFNANCLEASIIMLGLANETIINKLIEALSAFLDSNNYIEIKNNMERQLNGIWMASKKYDIYQDYLAQTKKKHDDQAFKKLFGKLDSLSSKVYANFTRITRNDLSHPSQVKMERIEVLMIFISFIKYCETQYDFINYFTTH